MITDRQRRLYDLLDDCGRNGVIFTAGFRLFLEALDATFGEAGAYSRNVLRRDPNALSDLASGYAVG